jgi:hypothetical protein
LAPLIALLLLGAIAAAIAVPLVVLRTTTTLGQLKGYTKEIIIYHDC